MPAKEWTGAAAKAQLSGSINTSALSMVTNIATGWPTGASKPFVAIIGRGTATEEKVLCATRSGTTFTITTRGYDNTTAATHSAGEYVEHVLTAETVTSLEDHVYNVALDQHTQYLNNARHDTPARHALGTTIAVATPVAVGTANVQGTSTSAPRSDHVHSAAEWTKVRGVGTPVVPGTPPAAGPWYTEGGHTSVTTNAGGEATVAFPLGFPGGVVVVVPISSGLILTLLNCNQSNFTVRLATDAGVLYVGAAVVSWIAIGY